MSLEFHLSDFIKDTPIYRKALTLANYGKSAPYERLEFLGDRVLGLYVANLLYRYFPKENEGAWAMRFTILVREETLAEIARQIGIPKLLRTKDNHLRDNNSILADVCEALIAAVYLDQGEKRARQFVELLWTPYLEQSQETIKDSKSALQEWAQKRGKMPVYTEISRTGEDHNPTFIMQVEIETYGKATGKGHSKKEAMKIASQTLLDELTKSQK